jgi:hypothetical protein
MRTHGGKPLQGVKDFPFVGLVKSISASEIFQQLSEVNNSIIEAGTQTN